MVPPGGIGRPLGAWAALASVLALAGLVQSCPPPGSRFVFRDGFLRNDTELGLSRRWVAIKPGDGSGDINNDGTNHNGKEWPNGLITACFDPDLTDDEVAEIKDGMRRGMGRWYTVGLTANSWRLDTTLTRALCETAGVTGRKANYLWVTKQVGDGTMAASAGNEKDGSTLWVQPDSWFSSHYSDLSVENLAEQKVRVYAHELGHLFGLLHEHQHPKAWSREHGGVGSTDAFIFHCENLADYDKCRSDVAKWKEDDQAEVDAYMTLMCTSADLAYKNPCWAGEGESYALSLVQWLPNPGSAQFVQFGYSIDERSGMIYDSYSGSKEYGKLVYEMVGFNGGDPKPVEPDGIFNLWPPNGLDVVGAFMLSPGVLASINQIPFFAAASNFRATWENQGNSFGECRTSSVSRRGLKKPNRQHEQLKRRGAEARAAMRRRLAAGSYV